MSKNILQQNPCVVLELVTGIDLEHSQIQIRHENMPQGWVTVAQILQQALGAVLPQAFGQLLQQNKEQEKHIVLAHGLYNNTRR